MSRVKAPTALSHLTVLDLTRVRAGPTCVRIFADFGADVIKIEAPDGVDPNEGMSGPRHGYDMQNLHRNKRSLALNLKTPEGLSVFKRMVAKADIVAENYRPDVKERLGIGYESLKAINPRIILVSVSGFGQTGPYSKHAGFDPIAQGMSGLMSVTGLPGQGPVRAGIAIADSSAGIYAATGVLVALAEREKSGVGQWVHTSLLQAQIAMNDFQAARYLVEGEVPPPAGNDHPYVTPMGMLKTADGYVIIGVGGEGQWRAFCAAIGLPELPADPRFATMADRYRHRPELRAILEPMFAERPSAEWISRLQAAEVPVGPIYAMDEVFADPQVTHLRMAEPVNHPVRGDIRLVAEPVTLSRTPAAITHALPEKGENTDEILRQFDIGTAEIAELKANRVI